MYFRFFLAPPNRSRWGYRGVRARSFSAWLLLALSSLVLASAAKSDTTTYVYDSLGRLVQVTASAGTGSTSSYGYDSADNRSNVTVVTGVGACSGVTFSISSNGAVTEGANSVFTVTKTGSTGSSCTVNYATANGTAVAPGDYTANSNTLTFTSAQTTQTVSVTTINDATVESAEAFTMALSSPSSGATIGTGTATATINDNDAAACSGVSFSISSNGAVIEGANSVFTVTKTGSTSSSCTVNYATANGTAAAPGDYTAKSGTLTFTSTQTSQTVSVATVNDTTAEPAESFTTTLSAPSSGATIGTGTATATINDNDSATCSGVSFAVNDVSGDEGTTFVFTVTKSGSTTSSCSVNYATADGSAVAPGDYGSVTGTLTFTATQTTQTVSVSVNANQQFTTEPTEVFLLNLSGATGGATISDPQGTGTIYDTADPNPCPLC